ncbi:hypothetical protein PMPD1_2208 [Paramixta manurensis]|uniref:Uncharacterized protein n=1 Tax=Paramixta manurensis TaxID=2740817 RepID=A0A6M8UPG9_9GAMM|nr:hypothetical protein PMPD1_2208 [Erwiniaceae bacterium PD-1]
MLNYIKKWLKYQCSYVAWTVFPVALVALFFIMAVSYFPSHAHIATLVFILCVAIFIGVYPGNK